MTETYDAPEQGRVGESRAVWMQRLFSAHRVEAARCPGCARFKIAVSDALVSDGSYKVTEHCPTCMEVFETKYDKTWVARTTARIRRERGTL